MASITFTDEASESFVDFLQHIDGYTVEVTPDPENDPAGRSEVFDATVIGSAADVTGDNFGVLVQLYDHVGGRPTGEPFAVVVRDLKVY